MGEKLILIHIGELNKSKVEQLEVIIGQTEVERSDIEIIEESGDAVDAILRVAKERKVDLLIAGAAPREGLLRYYKGSIARQLVRKSNCSLLLMTNPKKMKSVCGRMVVNGRSHPKTNYTIRKAAEVAQNLGAFSLTIVKEIPPAMVKERADDDKSVEKLNEKRKEIKKEVEERLGKVISSLNEEQKAITSHKIILGKTGYTIGHYAQTTGADLLVMNSPDTKLGFLDRVFTHDLEYILSELPSDLLIIHSTDS